MLPIVKSVSVFILTSFVFQIGVGKVLKKINKAIVSRRNKDIVKIANIVFANSGLKMEASFVSRNSEVFQCPVKNINFKDPNAASDTMNQWVKNKTDGT